MTFLTLCGLLPLLVVGLGTQRGDSYKHQGSKEHVATIYGEASIRRRRIGRLSLRGARAKPAPHRRDTVGTGRLLVPGRDTEMARREQEIRGRLWRPSVGAVALGAAALGLTSCGVPGTTATTDEAPSGTTVVECSSGTITSGDVQMSALSVTKVPAGEHPDIPGDCIVQTG